jgi:hypothetical protein
VARETTPPNADDVRALIAPQMDGRVEVGAFFRVAGGRRSGILGLLLWGPRQIAIERRAGFGAFTYLAVNGVDVGAFELRWNPLRIHRVLGHWHRDSVAARRVDRDGIVLTLDDRVVELVAAAPGLGSDEVIERLVAA